MFVHLSVVVVAVLIVEVQDERTVLEWTSGQRHPRRTSADPVCRTVTVLSRLVVRLSDEHLEPEETLIDERIELGSIGAADSEYRATVTFGITPF